MGIEITNIEPAPRSLLMTRFHPNGISIVKF